MTSGSMAVLFIFIGRMPFLAQTLDYADPLFALVVILDFYIHPVKVEDQDPTSGSLYGSVFFRQFSFRKFSFRKLFLRKL